MEFKSKLFILLILLCVLFTVAGVAAGDNQTDAIEMNDGSSVDLDPEPLQSSESQEVLGEDYGSYDDLYDDINASSGTFEMNQSYRYCDGDHYMFIHIEKGDFTINGNGHFIEGSNKAYGLEFSENVDHEVVINNLTFRNFYSSVLLFYGGKITLNNVNFINISYAMDVVYVGEANLVLNNCSFKSNSNGNDLSTSNANVTIINSNFTDCNSSASYMYINRGHLMIENCLFENLVSDYGGAINYKGDYFSIKRSKFINVRAVHTGGAILAKFFPVSDSNETAFLPSDDMSIEDCIFVNASSPHNGGAIYIDLDSGSEGIQKTLNISNCNFTDCLSGFGGAIVEQGGNLNIKNCSFANNTANHAGGALYTSWANLSIENSNFINNAAVKNAGAIYFDYGKLTIDHGNFTNNKADSQSSDAANTIYANDANGQIMNSYFENGGVAVYANFASISINESNNFNDDSVSMDNADYIFYVENDGIRIVLVNNSINVEKLPVKFDLRDYGWASPLKFQGDNMACWAFAGAAGLETSLLRATGILYNVSEDNIQNLQLRYFITGDSRNNATGFAYSTLGHSLSWYGVVMAEDDPYDERGMISDVADTQNRIHLQDAMIIFGGGNDTIELIKRAIMKYGAVTIQYSPVNFYYNYCPVEDQPTHFVPLIGWDDTIPAEKFESYFGVLPSGPGGWIVKDSEGPGIGDKGYDYISYYDKSFLANDYFAVIPQNAAVAYIFENTVDYHVNYQTDLTGLAGFDGNYTYYSNEFTSKYDELIGAVGTYFNESGINYSFDIYVNGNKVHSQTGISEFAGFRTIVLDKYIPIKTGDKFKVIFKNNALPFQAFSRQHYMPGMSLASADGESWIDFAPLNKTVCLKVYTVRDDTKIIDNKNISVDYDGGSYFAVKVVTTDGHAVGAGLEVKFIINGKTTTVKTDSNGIAKIKITQLPGKYTITTAYKGESVKNSVTVKQVLTTSKVNIKKTAKNLILKATLKINGKSVGGKAIKFNLNGKTYTEKTDKNGIAQAKISKKDLNKLKNAKTYTVKVTYLKDTIKTTVKAFDVVVLKAKKVTVKKTAKKLKLKATLKINAKAAKGKKITFKLNGKKYKAKTNKKGIAKKTLKKKVIKKLKKGKKYKVKVTYGKKTIKTTLKVKG